MFSHLMPLRRYNVKHKGDLDIQALPRLRSPVSTANEEAMEQCRHIRVHGCGNTQGAFVGKAWDTPLSDDPTAYSTRGAIFCKWYKMPTPPAVGTHSVHLLWIMVSGFSQSQECFCHMGILDENARFHRRTPEGVHWFYQQLAKLENS